MSLEATLFSSRHERLVGDIRGAYCRRVNIKHRLAYEVNGGRKAVKIISMCLPLRFLIHTASWRTSRSAMRIFFLSILRLFEHAFKLVVVGGEVEGRLFRRSAAVFQTLGEARVSRPRFVVFDRYAQRFFLPDYHD